MLHCLRALPYPAYSGRTRRSEKRANSRDPARPSRCAQGEEAYFLVDGSTNGSYINGRRVPKGVPSRLAEGDRVRLSVPIAGDDGSLIECVVVYSAAATDVLQVAYFSTRSP